MLVFRGELLREGLARVLQDYPNLEVVGTCSGTECATCQMEKGLILRPDIALIDSELLDHEVVLELMARARNELPGSKVILFSFDGEPNKLLTALRAGASGYVTVDTSIEDLASVLSLVMSGKVVLAAQAVGKLIEGFTSPQVQILDEIDGPRLTFREKDVVALAAKGATNKEIARSLYISEHTVKVHMRHILRKLNIHTRRQAMNVLSEPWCARRPFQTAPEE